MLIEMPISKKRKKRNAQICFVGMIILFLICMYLIL